MDADGVAIQATSGAIADDCALDSHSFIASMAMLSYSLRQRYPSRRSVSRGRMHLAGVFTAPDLESG